MDEIPERISEIMTSGLYPRIDILPGRTVQVVAPFAKRTENVVIRGINIGLYDMQTKVDIAGNSTKRANFNFEMVAPEKN